MASAMRFASGVDHFRSLCSVSCRTVAVADKDLEAVACLQTFCWTACRRDTSLSPVTAGRDIRGIMVKNLCKSYGRCYLQVLRVSAAIVSTIQGSLAPRLFLRFPTQRGLEAYSAVN